MATSVARYLLDNASSGTTPTTIADETGNGNALSIVYNGSGSWTSTGAGNGFDFTDAPITASSSILELTDILNNGNIGSSFINANRISFLIVPDVDSGSASGARIMQLGTDTGNGIVGLVASDLETKVRLNDVDVAGFPPLDGNGVRVIYCQVDTTQAAAADRVRLWDNGSEQTASSVTVAQNETFSLNNASYNLTLGNRGSGNRNFDGRIYYFELFSDLLTTQEIADSNTNLAANNDANWVGANNDPVLDTPISDISVSSNTSGTIADISGNFSDADSDPLTYGVTPALPAGMTLNTSTGVITGNGSITETAAANYTFSADDGQGGTPATDVVSIEVTAPALVIDSTDAQMQRNTNFQVTCSNPSTVPTTANATLTSGNDTLSASSVTGSGPYTITFPVGDLSKQVDGTGYVWTLDINGQTVQTAAIPLAIQAGWAAVPQVDPVTTEGSIWYQSTGDAPITGWDAEHETATSPSGIAVTVTATGGINLASAPTQDETFSFRAVEPDGTISSTETFTWDFVESASNSPATGLPTVSGTIEVGQTLTANTGAIADTDGLGTFSYQWYRDSTAISVATSSTYVIQVADIGARLRVDVSFTDGASNSEGPLASAQTDIVPHGVVIGTLPDPAIVRPNLPLDLSSLVTANPNGLTLTYSIASGSLPTGLTLNSTTGIISASSSEDYSGVSAAAMTFDIEYNP